MFFCAAQLKHESLGRYTLNNRRPVLTSFISFVLPALAASCMCQSGDISRARSPNGHLAAIVSSADCGATTRFSYAVTLQNAGWFHRDLRSLYPLVVFDVEDTTTTLTPADSLPALGIRPHWLSNTELAIDYYSRARVLSRDTLVGGITIRFTKVP